MEYGYILSEDGTIKDGIPPSLIVEYVSKTNLVYVKFSENIYIKNETNLQK